VIIPLTRSLYVFTYHPDDAPDISPVSLYMDTPDLTSSPNFEWPSGDYLTSPYDEFLNTPLLPDDGDMFTNAMDGAAYALFPSMHAAHGMDFEKPQVPAAPR
jgi:hypothetical protein